VTGFATRRPLAIVTTITSWDETPRIRHQVTRQLMRFCNVLYVELPFAAARAHDELRAQDGSLLVFRPASGANLARRLRNHLGLLRRWYDGMLVRRIERTANELGYREAALVNFQFDFDAVMRSRLFTRKLYLCNDEFQGDARAWVRSLNLHSEHEVVRNADLSLAVSFPLLEKLQRITPRAHLLLPGHESMIDAEVGTRPRTPPVHVCCMGFLNSRLVGGWLAALADDPRMRLTLIGPIENPQDWATLLARPGVTHHGTLVGAELQRRLREADVFVMPYDVTQDALRAITAPNKLFQYLACGRPVVCSNLPSLIKLPLGFLYTAADAPAFVAATWRAFAEDSPERTRARLAYAAANSWEARGDELQRMLKPPEVAHVRA
jgi:glycosyltransferase involved in cell wall biosynthesis